MSSLSEKHELSVKNEALELDDIPRDVATGEISELTTVAEGEERTTWFVWTLVACTSISGGLFGEILTLFGPRSVL